MRSVSIRKMENLARTIDLELRGREPTSHDLEPSLKEMLSRYAFCITQHNNAKKGNAPYPNKYDPEQAARETEIISAPISISEQGMFSLKYRKPGEPPSWQVFSSRPA